MHNSGTSLVGALSSAAGLPMGKRLLLRQSISPEKRPLYDYYEDQDVVALQDETLLKLQRHWSSYRGSFALPSPESEPRRRFREQLRELILSRLKHETMWVVKDPRTAVLLDDWITVLKGIQVEAKLVVVHRDPGANIMSFSSKGQVPELWAEALWQRSYSNALRIARMLGEQSVRMVGFSSLMRDPENEIQKVCSLLNWKPKGDLKEEIAKRFDPGMQTHKKGLCQSRTWHRATSLLNKRLEQVELYGSDEQELLSNELSEAIEHQGDPVKLNGLYINQQTLLPKLKVTIVTAEFQGWGPSGGIGSAYRELAKALREAGHTVRVVLVTEWDADKLGNADRDGVRVEVMKANGMTRLDVCRKVAECLSEDPGDVIHLHDWLGLGSGLRSRLGNGCPILIVGIHGPSAWTRTGNPWPEVKEDCRMYQEGLVRALEEDALAGADILVTPSRYMAQWVGEHMPQKREVLVQRNCPNTDKTVESKESKPTKRCLVYFGRLEERKGLLLFLEALRVMDRRDINVFFVGEDSEVGSKELGSEVAKQKLSELGIAYKILKGMKRVEALALIHEIGGVVAIPSLIENSPCVVEELLGSGLRVVATDVGGTSELVCESCHRWLSSPDAADMAAHFISALESVEGDDYRLKAKTQAWKIVLSWQAFHERLAVRQVEEKKTEQSGRVRIGIRRVLRYLYKKGTREGC